MTSIGRSEPCASIRRGWQAIFWWIGQCIAFAVVSCQALAQAAPDYIASMASYEVRQMTGSLAPANGAEILAHVTPSSWLTGDPGVIDLVGVVGAWSGGAKGKGTRLIVHGGGHNDSANNGVYVYDFGGGSRPTGFSLPFISPVSAVRQASTYSDGAPSATHTYDGVVYVSESNSLYRFGGAKWSTSGGFYGLAARFDFSSGTWTVLSAYPGKSDTEPSVIYDAISRKILVTMTGQSNAAFFRMDSNSWSPVRDSSREHHDSGFAYDPTRSRAVMVGGGSATLYNINWSAETFTQSALNATGATSILGNSALSAFYDPARDSFWLFGGKKSSPGYGNLYEMNASTFEIVQRPLSATTAGFEFDYNGSYGRFIFMDEWRAIGFLTRSDVAPFVIKLPPGTKGTSPPSPPSDIRAQ